MPNRALLALDFGGTKLSAAAAALDGTLRRVLTCPTPGDAAASLQVMLELADQLKPTAGWAACGVSFGGHVEPETGLVRRSLQVPGWTGVPLAATLRAILTCPVAVNNDGSCGALGEWLALGRRPSSLLYLTVSTGVGGGAVLGGKLYVGAQGMAAEFGHLRGFGGGRCTCGARGCLETAIAGPAIARRYQRIAAPSGAADAPTAQHVAAAAAHGDPAAQQVLQQAGAMLGRALTNLIVCFDPCTISIGGGVAKSGHDFWTSLHEQLRTHLPRHTASIRRATSVDEAPLRGAAELARCHA